MFFEKPDVRYVDMCIYIDNHIYTKECDHSLVFEYLYHISRMFAKRGNYFEKEVDYDDFSLYSATRYYNRLIDNRQFIEGEELEPIRSILNYIKKTLYLVRISFMKGKTDTQEVSEDTLISAESLRFYINKSVDGLNKCDFEAYIEDIPKVIKRFLQSIPYATDIVMWNNIYISCLLSFLNSITLKNKDLQRIENFKRSTSLTDGMIRELYNEEKYNSTILYHLDESMRSYITVLTNRIKHIVSRDLSISLHQYTPSYVNLANLMLSSIPGERSDY